MSTRRKSFVSALVIAFLATSVVIGVDDKKKKGKSETDATPENANPEAVKKNPKLAADFADQGEYTGTLAAGGKIGAQVVARGDGNFAVLIYHDGLPGDGYKPGKSKLVGPVKVKRDGDSISGAHGDKGRLVIKDGKLTGSNGEGKEIASMKRIERVSPTLGQKPPKGAVVLFDGTNADGWVHEAKRFTREGFLLRGTHSKRTFQSCKIHLEFRTPYEPKKGGQGRGNSGVYVQRRYEVQVLDSFGLKKYQTGDCGGIYSISPPDIPMCYPPLRWQTYDIEFTAAEFAPAEEGKKPKRIKDATMTVWHNGVLVHKDRKIFRNRTTASPVAEGPNPESIFFQNHGHWVVYRNVWVVPK